MLLVAVMIGCGGGGSGDVAGNGGTGGSGGNQNPPPPPPPDDDGPVQVDGPTALVRWSAAPGPVAGYNVLVSRNGGGFEEELTTPTASADIEGDPGDLVRVRVAAFDAFGNSGPF